MALPAPMAPMLAVSGEVPEGPSWAFEWMWDGVRAVVGVSASAVRARSKVQRDITGAYPELETLRGLTAHTVLLDGEIVTLDEHGRPDFDRLQARMRARRPTARLLRDIPASYYVFDVLSVDGADLCAWPYHRRRDRLAELGLPTPPLIRTPDHYEGVPGAELLHVAAEHGITGVIAKHLDSEYHPGTRSPNWIKRPLRLLQDAVVAGWVPGAGGQASAIGALLLGAHDSTGALIYIGQVDTGFDDAEQHGLRQRLQPLRRPSSPFGTAVPRAHTRHAHWVEPELVVEVEHRQWTSDGRLRHPVWRGPRDDRTPREVRLPAAS